MGQVVVPAPLRRARRSRADRPTIESLESRRHLSVIPPTIVTVSLGYREAPDGATARAHLNWVDNNTTETGYRVEYSPDGVSSWNPIAPDYGPNTTSVTQTLDAGQKYFYRVSALDASGPSAPSSVVTPSMPIDRAMQVTAKAMTSSVKLSWPTSLNAISYNVYRKARGDSSWTLLTLRPLNSRATYYVDPVAPGNAFEYQVQRYQHNYFWGADGTAIGYVYAGNQLAMNENPGRVLLVVDLTLAPALANDLTTYRRDLIGDGWNVDQILVPRDTGDAHLATVVKALIQTDALAHAGGLQSIVLIGHVPVPYSGTTAWDDHSDHVGAWPADSYYGESVGFIGANPWTDIKTVLNTTYPENSNLPGDGKFDQDALPNPETVPVGRIDFSNLPGMKFTFSPMPSDDQTETLLTQRYLQKDHLWRTAQVTAPMTAIEDDELGGADAENGWRNFAPLLGFGSATAQDWSTLLSGTQAMWSFGLGGASETNIANVINGIQLHANNINVGSVFNMFDGSYIADWNKQGNVMREVLGSAGLSLAAMSIGAPNGYFQTMALGETIGQAMLSTVNNVAAGPYAPLTIAMGVPARALLGDPTITQSVARPITNLAVSSAFHSNTLTWNAPAGISVQGYFVYRANSPDGPFTRINSVAIGDGPDLHFSDNYITSRTYTYMVRAIELQTGASGSFVQLSNGVTIQSQAITNPTSATQDLTGNNAASTDGSNSSDADDSGDIIDRLSFGYSDGLTAP